MGWMDQLGGLLEQYSGIGAALAATGAESAAPLSASPI